jgi:hypothetical protein
VPDVSGGLLSSSLTSSPHSDAMAPSKSVSMGSGLSSDIAELPAQPRLGLVPFALHGTKATCRARGRSLSSVMPPKDRHSTIRARRGLNAASRSTAVSTARTISADVPAPTMSSSSVMWGVAPPRFLAWRIRA